MKSAFAIALVALSASAGWADAPPCEARIPAAPISAANVEAAPDEKVEAEDAALAELKAAARAEFAMQLPAASGGFCGQAQVQAWMMRTVAGQQFHREQQAALKRALANQKIEVEKQITIPEADAPEPK